MAQLSGVLHSYDEIMKREDLVDQIANVSPYENPLTTDLEVITASGVLHEWGNYFQDRPSSNSAAPEGDEASFSDLAKPSRKNNICQNINEYFAVSGTDVAIDKAGPKDAYAREMDWAMHRWKNKAEYAVLRGTKASGASGVNRETNGIRNIVATDGRLTARTSGTSLSEDAFNGMFLDSWTVTDSMVIDLVLTTGRRRQDISRFTASNTRNVEASDKRLTRVVQVYEHDFGITEVKAHKDMAANEVLGIRKQLIKIAYLQGRTPGHKHLGVTGDNIKGMINGELTVQVDDARGMTLQTGYNL